MEGRIIAVIVDCYDMQTGLKLLREKRKNISGATQTIWNDLRKRVPENADLKLEIEQGSILCLDSSTETPILKYRMKVLKNEEGSRKNKEAVQSDLHMVQRPKRSSRVQQVS